MRPLRGGGGSRFADKKVRKKENRTLIETLINHLKSSENIPIDSLQIVLFKFKKSVSKINPCMSAAVTLNEFGVLELEDPAQNHMSSVQKEVPQIWRNERI